MVQMKKKTYNENFNFKLLDQWPSYVLYSDGEDSPNIKLYREIVKKLKRPTSCLSDFLKNNVEVKQNFSIPPVDLDSFNEFLYRLDDERKTLKRPFYAQTPAPIKRGVVGTKFPNLLAWIDQNVSNTNLHRRNELLQALEGSLPRQSKWHNPQRPGQGELYEALEKVIIQLKNYSPHSLPFLQRVNRKEVLDYYDIVKNPMDLGTMYKRLREGFYTSKAHFLADLELIYSNCFLYNTDPDSPFRRHVCFLKERWQTLMSTLVPDIIVSNYGASDDAADRSEDGSSMILVAKMDLDDNESLFSGQVGNFSDGDNEDFDVSDLVDSGVSSIVPTEGFEKNIGHSPDKNVRSEIIRSVQKSIVNVNDDDHFSFPVRSSTRMVVYQNSTQKAKGKKGLNQVTQSDNDSKDLRSACIDFESSKSIVDYEQYPEIAFFHQCMPDPFAISESRVNNETMKCPVPNHIGSINMKIRELRQFASDETSKQSNLTSLDSYAKQPNSSTMSSQVDDLLGEKQSPISCPDLLLDALSQGRDLLMKRCSMLLMQIGFDGALRLPLFVLGDLVESLLLKVLMAINGKKNLDEISAANSILMDRFTPAQLLIYLRDDPVKTIARLDTAIELVVSNRAIRKSTPSDGVSMDCLGVDESPSLIPDDQLCDIDLILTASSESAAL